jgi:hypothetical protein
MHVDVQADTVRDGVLGLVLALVEVIKDALELQALKRVDSGELGDDEVERLGQALVALDEAIEGIKVEQGIEEAVAAVRGGLDDLADELLDSVFNPGRWAAEMEA